ncbi:molybdopterin-guanine dinucleotide biosynthesis protein B [Aeromonas lusitana]|uniref:Molybdopterin-guanine dinucleotide biosynthesis protein B n=1 Tax=Aeromonas lusitana TaxID=931529 RepID=A0A2M8H8S7_9GAMM|nr:molybdopterin-guanine dinucleotide biosynthesis protein B [Aeromonas lusitana]PJC92930.1 molybdopterin-guanine dinucleotide biosynthesis protein B [Aeromonas lusitana]
MMDNPLPLLGFVAWSGTGKTTLLEQLIPLLTRRGLRLGVLKHTHHQFDMDKPGKDSYRLRKAGAGQVMAASSLRHALIRETPEGEPSFADLLASFDWSRLDLLLIEGFKHEHFPKIELHRAALGRPLMYPSDPDVIALVSDEPHETPLPRFEFGALPALCDFICARLAESPAQSSRPESPEADHMPLRLLARAITSIPLAGSEPLLPGHLSQDANGILQVGPAHALMRAGGQVTNCLIERPSQPHDITPGERVWVRPLAR